MQVPLRSLPSFWFPRRCPSYSILFSRPICGRTRASSAAASSPSTFQDNLQGRGPKVSGRRTGRPRGRDKASGGEAWWPTMGGAVTQVPERPRWSACVASPKDFGAQVVPSTPEPRFPTGHPSRPQTAQELAVQTTQSTRSAAIMPGSKPPPRRCLYHNFCSIHAPPVFYFCVIFFLKQSSPPPCFFYFKKLILGNGYHHHQWKTCVHNPK